MKKKILNIAAAVSCIAVLFSVLTYKTDTLAAPTSGGITIPGEKSNIGGLATKYQDENDVFTKVINTGIKIIAGISVVMIVYGGFQYIIGGDKGQPIAKSIITAAVVGLVVSLLAYAIVNWVVVKFIQG